MSEENIEITREEYEELIDTIFRQKSEILELKAILSPGWGEWKLKEMEEELKKFKMGFAYKTHQTDHPCNETTYTYTRDGYRIDSRGNFEKMDNLDDDKEKT